MEGGHLASHDGPTLSSRERILRVAKTLFATKGYEQATTAAIARNAATSETQLLKHFGNKQGLLDAIFVAGWDEIVHQSNIAIANISDARQKLAIIFSVVNAAMDRDRELKLLILLEGRRIRKGGPMLALSSSFLAFVAMLDGILSEMYEGALLPPQLHPQAIRSALMGMLEGLLRDKLLAHEAGYPAAYDLDELPKIFERVLVCFTQPGKNIPSPRIHANKKSG